MAIKGRNKMLLKLVDELFFLYFAYIIGTLIIAFFQSGYENIKDFFLYVILKKERKPEPLVYDWEWEEICERNKN